jgi:hypothetical protein
VPRSRRWTDQQMIDAVQSSASIRQVLIALELNSTGANYRSVHDAVARLRLDTRHWTGQGHLRRKSHSTYGSTSFLKKRLVNEGVIEEKCALCVRTATRSSRPSPDVTRRSSSRDPAAGRRCRQSIPAIARTSGRRRCGGLNTREQRSADRMLKQQGSATKGTSGRCPLFFPRSGLRRRPKNLAAAGPGIARHNRPLGMHTRSFAPRQSVEIGAGGGAARRSG